jgi:hypothetical protein
MYVYKAFGTTSNYSAIANLHPLEITTAPAKPFSACCVLTSRSLATACNSGDSSASRAQILVSQPPVQNSCQLCQFFLALLAELNWTVNPQLTCCHRFSIIRLAAISHQPPSLLFTGWLSVNNWTGSPSIVFLMITLHGPNRKHSFQQFLYCWYRRLPTRCLETAVCWIAYCTATAVLVTIYL